jgi:hypothetical protein
MREKKEERLNEFYAEQKKIILPFTKRDLLVAGLFLYWGEGSKTLSSSVSVSNTDPSVINFFAYWAANVLKVPKEKMHVTLHLYDDMNIPKEIEYWSKKLTIPKKQFTKPYIKQSSIKAINHKGGFGHGTCNLRIANARLSEKVLMTIKAISNEYSNGRL